MAAWGSQSRRAALDLAAPKPPQIAPRPAWWDILDLPTANAVLRPQAASPAPGPITPYEGEIKALPAQSPHQRAGEMLVNDHAAYVLGPILGAGGYCVVRLAVQLGAAGGQLVAVKDWDLDSLKKDDIFRPSQRLAFALQEYEMMRKALSPLCASLSVTRDAKDEPKHLYAILPPLPGDGFDITHRVRRHKPAATSLWARHVLCTLADELVNLRARGVLHADIKLDNLFLDTTYRLHLGDFGLAAPLGGPQKTRGTIQYVAKEVLDGLFDDRADVWASGVTTLTVLGGNPFAPPMHIKHDLTVDDGYELRKAFSSWREAELAGKPLELWGERTWRSHVNRELRTCQKAEQAWGVRDGKPTLFKFLVEVPLQPDKRERVNADALLPAVEPMRLSRQENRTLQKALLQLPPTPAARLIARALLHSA